MTFLNGCKLFIIIFCGGFNLNSFSQAYPERPIKRVVGLAAGGPTDLIARIIAKRLSDQIGQSVIVENKVGAGGSIAAEFVARSEPDGYTLLWASSSLALLPIVAPMSKFSPDRDLLSVTAVAAAPSVLLVRNDSPYKTFDDLYKSVKAKPGELSFGSPGIGTSSHLAAAVMIHAGGLRALHVPYKGNSQVMQDLLAGQIDFMFDSTLTAMPMIQSQKLRPLAVTPISRSTVLPDIPTLDESGIAGFDMVPWFAIFGPNGMRRETVNRLSEDMQRVVLRPEVIKELASRGSEPYYKNSQDLKKLLGNEIAMWKTKLEKMGLNLSQ